MARSTYTIRLGFKWWVPWLIRLAVFNLTLGIPVDEKRLTRIITEHGLIIERI